MTRRLEIILAILIFVALISWSIWLAQDATGRILSFSLLSGLGFGVVLQRGRFCFLCNFRDFIEQRDASGLLAIVVALAAGILFYQAVLGAWVPVPQPDRLPAGAHIGPVGIVLVVAALSFGLGMALSGSCLSAHLYRLGEGAFGSIAALIGAGFGFLLGFISWNSLYSLTLYDDPPLWLPGLIGYAGASLLALALLALLTILILWRVRHWPAQPLAALPADPLQAVFIRRWPPLITGLLIAAISAFAYLRVTPLGVTAELGSLVRSFATSHALIPETLTGLDLVRGCISALKTSMLSNNGLFVLGLVLASLAAALLAGNFKPSWPPLSGLAQRFIGGILMGWGAMTGLGCTIGVLLSGIHAGALSGWLFLIFVTSGAWIGLRLKSHWQQSATT